MKRALLLRTDHLGDLILTTPLIKALHREGNQVDILAGKVNSGILTNNPHVHETFSLEDICPDFPTNWMAIVIWLRKKKYDTLIVPHAKPAALIYVSTLSGANVKILMQGGILGRILGNTCLKSNLLKSPRHMTEVWLDIARFLGATELDAQPEIFLTDDEVKWGKTSLASKFGTDAMILGIHPGGAGNTCNLPFHEYGELARLFLERTNYKLVITGSKAERALMEKWPESLRRSERVWISAGEFDLRQLSSIIKNISCLICSGTGPLHLANAVGAATFSPFCSRIGHDYNYWGNTNGKGKHVTVTTSFCQTQLRNCQFAGGCSAQTLFQDFIKIIPGQQGTK